MKLRNIRIQTQLIFGFALMFTLIIILGTVSYIQYSQLHQQTEYMYRYPLQVRRAIGSIDVDIEQMRGAFLEMAAQPNGDSQAIMQRISLSHDDIGRQLAILEASYLGESTDIDAIRVQYTSWKSMLESHVQQAVAGDSTRLAEALAAGSRFSILSEELENQLRAISDFSRTEADALYNRSIVIRNEITVQSIVVLGFILALFLFMSISLIRSIRKPLNELADVSQRFGSGDLSARSTYSRNNEFGELLDVTRINENKITLKKERVELIELARRTVIDHQAMFRDKGVEFDAALPADEVWLDADPVRMTQVLENLLHNALKFTRRSDRVTIDIRERREHSSVTIRIVDTGIGIEKDLLDKLFTPFTQADRSLARSQGGLGLGLAIVKGIVDLHGGFIDVVSDGQGKGCTFTIMLPTVPAHSQPQAAHAPERRLAAMP